MRQLVDERGRGEQSQLRYRNEAAKNPPPETSWGKLLPWVVDGSYVLEVGCAHGSFSSALRAKNCHVVGVELDPLMAADARNQCDQVILGDVDELLRRDGLPKNFDLIIAADVLEHLARPLETLRRLAALLRQGGSLLASIPNVTHMSILAALAEGTFPRRAEGLLDSTHVQFYGEADILSLFNDAGYAVRIVDRVRVDPRLTEFHTDLAAIPPAVLEYFDQNPNSNTYQFIVRAVPLAWAAEADKTPSRASGERQSIVDGLAVQLVEAESKLKKYHEVGVVRDQKLVEQQEEIAKYHHALASSQAEVAELRRRIREYQDEWASSLEHLSRLQTQSSRPLTPEERLRLRVLFVTDRDDACYRYRCLNACEQLRAAGVVANIKRLDQSDLLEAISRYSVVILVRLPWSDRVEEVIRLARVNGAKVGFEIDDLIFRPEIEGLIPFLLRLPHATVEKYRAQLMSLRETLKASDFCVAATPTLARHATYEDKVSLIHPNMLSETYLRLGSIIYALRPALLRDELIGYMSGSHTHDGDLEHVVPALRTMLETRRDLRLVICGPVKIPVSLHPFRSRILRFSYQDNRVYPWLMARCRTVIAPVQVVNDFTNSKSALKVFEAGIFGIPVVASPIASYLEAVDHGRSGFIAGTTDEWVEALSKLMDRRASLALGQAAREVALREYSPQKHRWLLARNLLRHCGTASGDPPELASLELTAAARASKLGRQVAELALKDPEVLLSSSEHFANAIAETAMLEEESNVSKWLACAERRGRHLILDGQDVGVIVADREEPLARYTYNDQVESLPDALTQGAGFQIVGPDPIFMLPGFPPLQEAELVVLEMSAATQSMNAWGQLFFSMGAGPFNEEDSLGFPVVADGKRRTYVLPIPKNIRNKFCAVDGTAVRFDPLDQPGTIEVTRIAVLTFRPDEDAPIDVRRSLAARFLRGRGIEIGALQNPLQVPPEARVQYVDRLTVEQARAEYPELGGQPLVEPSIIAEAESLEPILSNSQDFAICNHVLEHMKDPIGAVKQWIRVLKPGGRLYLAIPDHSNPLDRHRAVTSFEHLLDDHRSRASREEADEEHYWDFTRSAHREMSPQELEQFTSKLIQERYSIHFHAFDLALFEKLLAHVCADGEANTVELLHNREADSLEYVAVLEKNRSASTRAQLPVDIVIPIYNARDLARRCIESVLTHATGNWRLILVNDASTEEDIEEDLNRFARADARVHVVKNETNQGFIGSANRGMQEAAGRDVLLLNSDTEVFAEFLDRMRACAYADASTGVLSPLSNNATICSIPEMGKDNPIPDGFTAESFARLIAAASKRRRPELVTAVGFCMYIKAELFDRIGYFDESFGRGFGEENDFCERAKQAGFQIRLCDDVFVLHRGKASFGDEGHALESTNARLLEAKQPGYHAAVARFFEENPLAPIHQELRFHIQRLGGGRETALLYVLHASPFAREAGGVELHVRDLIGSLALPRAVMAYPSGHELIFAEVLNGNLEQPILYRFPLSEPIRFFSIENREIVELMERALTLFGIGGVHLHHLLTWPLSLPQALKKAGQKLIYTSHDYYCVCPSWNLFDHSTGSRCECKHGDPVSAGCLPALITQLGGTPPGDLSDLRARHRATVLELLGDIDAWIFPSSEARDVVRQHLPIELARTQVIEHGCDLIRTAEQRGPGSELRLAVIGEVTYPIKGAENYIDLVRRTSGLPLEWHFFGTTSLFNFEQRVRQATSSRVEFHGRYQRAEIANQLATAGIDLCVVLPRVDETFSLVVSESLIAGIPVLALEKGALPERLVEPRLGICVKDVDQAARWIAGACDDRGELDAISARVRQFKHRSLSDNAAAHRELYQRVGIWPPSPRPLPETLHELFAFSDGSLVSPPVPRNVEAPPRYQSSRWYPAFLRLKPFVPGKVRMLGRKALVGLEHQSLKLKASIVRSKDQQVANLRVIRRGLKYSRYQAEGPDPQIVFAPRPFAPQSVTKAQFRLRHDFRGTAYAQLFWTHSPDEHFSEAKSAKVTLEPVPGKWREYTFRLDDPRLKSKWEDGGREIVQLRLDPMNVPAGFELGPLELLH